MLLPLKNSLPANVAAHLERLLAPECGCFRVAEVGKKGSGSLGERTGQATGEQDVGTPLM